MAEIDLRKQLAFVKTLLLDSGPLVAYLNPSDPSHKRSLAVLNPFRGVLITTSAVIVEAMHFMKRFGDGPEKLVEFVEGTEMEIMEACQSEPLQQAVKLMRKYADIPMDFPDASLVVVANELNLREICTIDRRGFDVFRTSRGKRFHLVLDDD